MIFTIVFFLLLMSKNGETFWGRQNGFITTENLYDVWGTSSDFVIAAGANGTVIRYDGLESHARNRFRPWVSSFINTFVFSRMPAAVQGGYDEK